MNIERQIPYDFSLATFAIGSCFVSELPGVLFMAVRELPVVAYDESVFNLEAIQPNELSVFNLPGDTNVEVTKWLDERVIIIILRLEFVWSHFLIFHV